MKPKHDKFLSFLFAGRFKSCVCCLLPPGLSCRKVASLHQLVDGVEEEDAHGEEEQGGEGSLVHSLDG